MKNHVTFAEERQADRYHANRAGAWRIQDNRVPCHIRQRAHQRSNPPARAGLCKNITIPPV